MIKIKNLSVDNEEMIKFLKGLKIKQKNIEDKESLFYPKISLYTTLKYNIFFKNFLLHPIVLKSKKYYEDKNIVDKIEDIVELLGKTLTFELTENITYLTVNERDQLVKVHKKLLKKIEKVESNI